MTYHSNHEFVKSITVTNKIHQTPISICFHEGTIRGISFLCLIYILTTTHIRPSSSILCVYIHLHLWCILKLRILTHKLISEVKVRLINYIHIHVRACTYAWSYEDNHIWGKSIEGWSGCPWCIVSGGSVGRGGILLNVGCTWTYIISWC